MVNLIENNSALSLQCIAMALYGQEYGNKLNKRDR